MELSNKRILAIDYGTKFTGLANIHFGQDPFVLLYGRIKYESDTKLIEDIQKIIEDEFIDFLVLGIPYMNDGSQSDMTKRILEFKNQLISLTGLEVFEQDESLSSYAAEEKMKNDPKFNFKVDMKQIDAVAASIILEDFLNSFPKK